VYSQAVQARKGQPDKRCDFPQAHCVEALSPNNESVGGEGIQVSGNVLASGRKQPNRKEDH
jgi:hypothetical protein